MSEPLLLHPGTIYETVTGQRWVVLSAEAGVAAMAPIVPQHPAKPGDVALHHGGAVRCSGVKVTVPKGRPVGCISEIERRIAVSEAEAIAATRAKRVSEQKAVGA